MKQTVKETVEFVYSYLKPYENGVALNAKEFGKTGSMVVTSLVKRGILEKGGRGSDQQYQYKWVATMAPTKTLYESISMELKDRQKRYKQAHSAKAKKAKEAVSDDAPSKTGPSAPTEMKSLERRLNELYPVFDFDDEMAALFRRCGYGEDEIALAKSRRIAMNAVNARLREAYMLGRKEKEEYE